jgi:hypothetical protein
MVVMCGLSFCGFGGGRSPEASSITSSAMVILACLKTSLLRAEAAMADLDSVEDVPVIEPRLEPPQGWPLSPLREFLRVVPVLPLTLF